MNHCEEIILIKYSLKKSNILHVVWKCYSLSTDTDVS